MFEAVEALGNPPVLALTATATPEVVDDILRRHDLSPAPKRSQTTTWKEFIRRHMDVLAGTDFFTVEVLTWRGPVTYYVLFFLHLETRRVSLAGITRHPTEEWMTQMARNAVDEESGYLRGHRYVLHDRDTKFCAEFRNTLKTGGVKCLQLPPRSPNLNAFAERCLSIVRWLCPAGKVAPAVNRFHRPKW